MSRIQDILETSFEPRTYSGKGMYGKECLAVTVRECSGNPIAYVCGQVIADLEGVSFEDLEEIAEAVKSAKSDQLGKGYIVYFPIITYEEG